MMRTSQQVANASQHPLSIHGSVMTKERTKKMKKELNGLIDHISNSCIFQEINVPELNI